MTMLNNIAERDAIIALALAGLRDLLEEQGREVPSDPGAETALIGKGAALDSLGLVTLIIDLEARVEEQYGIIVTIADERAMSQQRSPFRTIGTLADYVCGLLTEA